MLNLFRKDSKKNQERTKDGVRRSRETWFGKIVDILHSSRMDDSVWDELEEILISADLGVGPSSDLVSRLKARAKDERLDQAEQIFQALKAELTVSLQDEGSDHLWDDMDSSAAPYVILVAGVNGVGKTTSIAKLANRFQEEGKTVLIGAADTFRAAAIDQLQMLCSRIGVDVVSHQQGADPGAVVYDAYQASKARKADVLIIDTAGRLHTKRNLMEELKKIRRILTRLDPSCPHQVLLILDATTGYNGLAQAKTFTEAVDCTGVFLTKLDGTARGGIVLAVRTELNIPILFIGTGEHIQDIAPFDATEFVEALLEPASASRPQSM